MPEFFVSTAKGLVDPLFDELTAFGLKGLEKTGLGVYFEGNWRDCYYVNLHSRVASRVLKPILDFPAYEGEDLYHNILKHDFTKYIDQNQSFKIEASVIDGIIRDQRFAALKIKDAIADQFREKYGERPNVEKENPDLRIYVRAVENRFSVAIDTTGDSLFMRGYRLEAGIAPLKENLAAGLLQMMEWDGKVDLYDPMCGSGTILIEAALKALNIAPGSLRKRFGFMNLKGFQEDVWSQLVEEAMDAEKQEMECKLFGSDVDKKVLQAAKQNALRAGVDHLIDFKHGKLALIEPPTEMGIVVSNPPYGARLGEEDMLLDEYRDFGFSLKTRFKGWTVWLLAGNKELTPMLKMKSSRKFQVFNGPIECRFLKYEVK